MKRLLAALLGAALLLAVGALEGPALLAYPVYTVPQVLAGLTPRHNVWGGRTLWVRAVAVLGRDVGILPDRVVLFDHAPPSSSDGFYVWAKAPNLAFTTLSWEAWIAHTIPGLRWLYGQHPGVYRVRFFQPTWCMSCPVGQLE